MPCAMVKAGRYVSTALETSPIFSSDVNNFAAYKLGICTTQSPYQTRGTHHWCSSFLGLLEPAVLLGGSGVLEGFRPLQADWWHSICNCRMMKCSGGNGWREIAFGSDAGEGTAFRSTWDALGPWVARSAIAKCCFCVAAMSSSSSVHRVQLKGNII
jgi:hypothetical protein